jgi:multidrug resistance efflux pump
LEEFVARSQEARRRHEDRLGRDGERLRAEIHRTGEDFLDGVDWAWARIEEGSGSGLAELEHQVSQLRLGFSALEWALDRQLAAIASHSQGLIGRNALEDRSATAEQQASLFLDAAERLRISAEERFGKRVGEVELAVAQKQDALELIRARLRQAMAAADGADPWANARPARHDSTDPAHLADEQQPLETTRARYASAVARAEWALKAAKLALEAKVVRAPMDGVITAVGLQERTTLASNEVVGVVEDLDGLIFKAMVPERELPGVAVGQRVHLSVDVDNHRQAVEARVSWIGRGGLVFEKDQRPWNVLVAVEGTNATLMPALLGRAEIVVGRPTGLERLRELMRPSPSPVRRYLNPELPDPTRVLPRRPEPATPGPPEQEPAVEAPHDSLATSATRLVERRGN